MQTETFERFDHQAVLRWYEQNGRTLPWRAKWPALAPAYHVFLSEFMLQQTGVKTVIPYFNHFISKWPTIFALAEAELDDVLADWAGLGYYARARNMHKTAQILVSEYNGEFPHTEAELRRLPGIGPYTAGAILCFAFDQPAIVLDGNIERILIRFGGIDQPVKQVKPILQAACAEIFPPQQHADFPQALMDIASLVCQPKSANCSLCPLQTHCKASQLDRPESLPVKAARQAQPIRHGKIYMISNSSGALLMYKRPSKGLLGGMLSFPTTGWDKSEQLAPFLQPLISQVTQIGRISHVFTHFKADISVYHLQLEQLELAGRPEGFHWAAPQPSDWPKLMQKSYHLLQHQLRL